MTSPSSFDNLAESDLVAQNNIGRMYEYGENVPQSYTKVTVWYMKSAIQGNTSAQNNVGVLYRDGKGVAQDDKNAREWVFKAADQGYAVTQRNLGMIHRQTSSTPRL